MVPLNKSQIELLREKYSIYLLDNGRMNISGLKDNEMEYFANIINKEFYSHKNWSIYKPSNLYLISSTHIMNIHLISINKNALNNIKSHKKTIEGRLKKGYFNKIIQKNDKIIFYNQNDKYIVLVKEVVEYDNIYKCLINENILTILPHIDNIDNAYNHYLKYYSDENLNKYKFLAIKF